MLLTSEIEVILEINEIYDVTKSAAWLLKNIRCHIFLHLWYEKTPCTLIMFFVVYFSLKPDFSCQKLFQISILALNLYVIFKQSNNSFKQESIARWYNMTSYLPFIIQDSYFNISIMDSISFHWKKNAALRQTFCSVLCLISCDKIWVLRVDNNSICWVKGERLGRHLIM